MDLVLKYSALARHPLKHLECTSFDPMPAELGAITAAVLIPLPLLTVQERVVENDGKSSNKRRVEGRGLGTKGICARASFCDTS